MSIDTAQLTLRALTPRELLALIESATAFEKAFGAAPANGLREMYTGGDVSQAWLAALREATTADPWMHGFAVVHRADVRVIGCAGFKGPPDESGTVEIAYGIAPGYRDRGYATEAAGALMQYAAQSGRVRLLCAHTLPTKNASTRVLGKCGFAFVGERTDPDDGLVWRWERPGL